MKFLVKILVVGCALISTATFAADVTCAAKDLKVKVESINAVDSVSPYSYLPGQTLNVSCGTAVYKFYAGSTHMLMSVTTTTSNTPLQWSANAHALATAEGDQLKSLLSIALAAKLSGSSLVISNSSGFITALSLN